MRVKYQRVQFATVNKYAAETRPYLSPFVLLRNAVKRSAAKEGAA